MTFDVICEYANTEFDSDVDRRIEAAAGCKSDFAGCGVRAGMSRELGWILETAPAAIAMRQRILSSYEGWPKINVCVKER